MKSIDQYRKENEVLTREARTRREARATNFANAFVQRGELHALCMDSEKDREQLARSLIYALVDALEGGEL